MTRENWIALMDALREGRTGISPTEAKAILHELECTGLDFLTTEEPKPPAPKRAT